MSHMSLDNRITIQEGLNQRSSLRAIAKAIKKAPSTIQREISNHKYIKDDICTDKSLCDNLKKSPHVCNGCLKLDSCMKKKRIYYATYAHTEYRNKLIDAREGIDMNPERIQEMDDLVSPLIKNGQSIAHVFATHSKEIGCSRTTLYKYINESILTARNLDLPRKVRYKPRQKNDSNKKLTKEERLLILSRSYDHFKKYLEEHPDTDVVEMDTVLGPPNHSKKAMLTLLFRSCNLMLIILLEEKTQEAVVTALNNLCNDLGYELFCQLFPVILTDRGNEFLNPIAMEGYEKDKIKTKIFYCDKQSPWQKGALEKNHEFIRYVIPKDTSFDDYTQDDITLMANHINSFSRDKFHGKTPYAISRLMIDNHLHEVMKLTEIAPDDVNLKPALLRYKPK